MKKLFSISVLMLILHIIPNQLFSQTKSINANTSYTGLNCRGNSSAPCTIDYVTNKSLSNTQISFNKENNELIFIISKSKIDTTSKSKLLNNELEKDIYLYTFDEDFILSTELKKALNIKNLSKIKQGSYLIKIVKDQIIMKLKLE